MSETVEERARVFVERTNGTTFSSADPGQYTRMLVGVIRAAVEAERERCWVDHRDTIARALAGPLIDDLRNENARLLRALTFYADGATWTEFKVASDFGQIARDAVGGK